MIFRMLQPCKLYRGIIGKLLNLSGKREPLEEYGMSETLIPFQLPAVIKEY